MSIRKKLTLMMIGISLAAVMLTVAGITSYLIYDMRKVKAQELKVTAAVTGDRNSAALLFLDQELATQNLEIFRLNPSILTACIYDLQGGLFASYQSDGAGRACPASDRGIQASLPNLLIAFEEITKTGKSIGRIYMAEDMREIDAYIYKIILISATVAGIVLALVLLAVIYLQRTISRPIMELTATVQSVTASRDYDHSLELRSSRQDETGILVNAFNEMIQEVRKRDFELIHANETLEMKVIERTHQLEEEKRRAEKASEAKSEFLRNMSHEFRTPLHAMISFSTYGMQEYETAERQQLKHYFEMVQRGAKRLSRLVNEVLDLASMEQRRENNFVMGKADIHALAQQAADQVSSLLKEKKITLQLPETVDPLLVQCDEDKIVQVFTNLLGNAIKFTPKEKSISVTMESDGNQAVISVIDQGVGIPEDEKEVIFESFQQSSRTNKGAGGSGLGLAICRNILEAHHGSIRADNNTDSPGACFRFTLPLAGEAPTDCSTEEGNYANIHAA